MPAFSDPFQGKRKSDASDDFGSRKRTAYDSAGGPSHSAGAQSLKEQYWMVQWRAPQNRKHKTWDGDAVLVVTGSDCRLFDMDGTSIGAGKSSGVVEGVEFKVGNKEVEIDRAIPREEYLSGACFGRGTLASTSSTTFSTSTLVKKFVPLRPVALNPHKSSSIASSSSKAVKLQAVNLFDESDALKTPLADKGKAPESCWTANWRKPQNKKHKTWDGDAYVVFADGKLKLIAENGKILGVTAWKGTPLTSGYHDMIGGRQIELDSCIPSTQVPKVLGAAEDNEDPIDEWEVPAPAAIGSPSTFGSPAPASSASSAKKFVQPMSFYGKPPPKPAGQGSLHDPEGEDALVMKSPSKEHATKFNKKNLPIVPVVIDPIVARKLRPHQREGVKFMYECVMGLRKHEGQGCILADEMGLGKTLQTISLVWTLLKQNPYAGVGPVVGKVLIVCPVSLVNNWKAEFHKWLGRDRVGVFTGDKDKGLVKHFINSRIHHVLIIGYEKLRTVIKDLAYCNPPIGLIICDEGHRLKSANNKTSKMFEALRTPRRIILSGTPIQNDLSEFHSMADFCNPGLLDDYNTFKKVYETPILKSRAPGCTSKEAEIGEARTAQLLTTAKSFVLRRDATILKNYLPPKTEYVVFVTPTSLQLSIFGKILRPDKLDSLVQGSTAESLALINMLTKISNSPILLKATLDKAKTTNSLAGNIKAAAVEEAVKLLPERAQVEDLSLSGKLAALANLLNVIRKTTEEKCIIVSHYTSTLNIIEAYCNKKKYTYFRLDGQTPPAKRQDYVNAFNRSSQTGHFLFLLSAKAGGVGLNLIGASRLCLIDSDWNPSHDLQAMARIHRDGQKRPVFIYRFLTAGTIDEKIFQRQVTKLGLSNSLMGTGAAGSKSDSFTGKDLRDIFSIHPNTACHTHDLLECPCDGVETVNLHREDVQETDDTSDVPSEDESETDVGFRAASQIKPGELNRMDKAYAKRKKAELAALGEWTHIHCLKANARDNVQDDILRKVLYTPKVHADAEDLPPPPKSRLDALLEAADIDNVLAIEAETNDPGLSVRDVPGGTVSFLFERSSKTPLAEDGGDAEE